MGFKRCGEYKQMAFETAIRNPERYKGILENIIAFEGKVLNDEILLEIVCRLYIVGEVSSNKIAIDEFSTVIKIKKAVKEVNITRNADGGFPKGYQSRFWTYMRTLSEFGFVYARYNKELKISPIAKMLISNKVDEQEAFSIQALKYNRMSPYRRVLNDYNYFRFILEVLEKLESKGKALSYEQFILSLFSKTGSPDAFIQLITEVKLQDIDTVYSYIQKYYPKPANTKGVDTPHNRQTVLRDYPDVVLRLLRITGFITIVYSGKVFIRINSDKTDYIRELLKIDFSMSQNEKTEEILYYNKMNENTADYFNIAISFRATDRLDGTVYANKLSEVVKMYAIDEDKVSTYILNIANKTLAPEFKYVPDPLKLEFYISMLVFIKYGSKYAIRPNYKIDSLGMPISHAPGNVGDIEVYNSKIYWLIEVTLIRNKTQQTNNETTSVVRHLSSSEEFSKCSEKYLSLVAPVIHEDTKSFLDFSIINCRKENLSVFIKTYNLEEFVNTTRALANIKDMKAYSDMFVADFMSKLS